MADTLLLADDSTTMQRVVELTFAEQGVRVVSVSDGQQAVDYIARQSAALVLVSVGLPRMNGFEVARYVRDELQSRVPVLLLAGAFDNVDETQARAAGAAGVLVKPFEPAVVIKRVKELLGMNPESAKLAAVPAAGSPSGRMVTSSEAPQRTVDSTPAARVAVPPTTDRDHLDHLEAAFDSLDTKLASPVPSGGPVRTPPLASATGDGLTAADRAGLTSGAVSPRHDGASGDKARPVFEVDDTWFDKPPTPTVADSLGELAQFVVTRASDFGVTQSGSSTDEQRTWPSIAAKPIAAPTAVPAVSRAGEQIDPARVTVPDPSASAREADPVELRRDVVEGAFGREDGPSVAAPDAFAMVWAQEQGAAVSSASSATTEFSDQAVDAIASRLAERVVSRLAAPLADRVVDDMGGRLAIAVGDRVTSQLQGPLAAGVGDRVTSSIGDRVAAAVGEQVSTTVADHLSTAVTDRLTGAVVDRMSATIGERAAEVISDRVVASLAESVSAAVANRMTTMLTRAIEDLAPRVATEISTRLVDDLAQRIGTPLADRLNATLGDRLSSDLAERVAALVAERALRGAAGDSWRETVNSVAERIVRAEIERIKAAADALRR